MSQSRTYPLIFTFLVLFLMTSCTDGIECCTAGPCIHEYREPVFIITDATINENESVDFVTLSQIKINGSDVSAIQLPQYMIQNITITDGKILCEIPCGFGYDDGTFAFNAQVGESDPKAFSFSAAYSKGGGGCPSFSDGGTRVTLEF